jgi:hypothetical protein
MTYPLTAKNAAQDSATVGLQAETVHGDVYTYFVQRSSTAKEKYEAGVRYLNGGASPEALRWIEQAIADGHDDTSEVRFYWLLSMLSGRTYRQLSPDITSRLDAFKNHPVVSQTDLWADGVRLLIQLVTSLRSPGSDPGPFIDALDHLHPPQRELLLRHISMFLQGPRGDQLWQLEVEAAEAGRFAKQREDRVRYFFTPSPVGPQPRPVSPAAVSLRDRAAACIASFVFVLALLSVGWEVIMHVSVVGVLGYVVGCGGASVAAVPWVESRWQARQRAEYWRLLSGEPPATALKSTFGARASHQLDYFFRRHAPGGTDGSGWLSITAEVRARLRDEFAEIYVGKRINAERLNWLFAHEARQAAQRWRAGTLHSPANNSRAKPAARMALRTGIVATVLGVILVAIVLLSTNLASEFISLTAFVVLAYGGYRGSGRWTHIVLERRREASDAAERDRKFSERQTAYEAWRSKLAQIRPSDQQMAEWLDYDKKVLLKSALHHYALKRSDVISYSFLETPGDSYERASVRNGPWRYTRYKIYVFLLTTDGIRQIVYDLGTRHGDTQQRERRSYRYDSISSVEASLPKDGSRQKFDLHLMDGQTIDFRLAEPVTDWDPEKGDANALSRATEDATGLRNTLRILEGVAADGKEWIARETQ